MDLLSLYNISSGLIKEAAGQSMPASQTTIQAEENGFGSLLNAAIENINTTNSYLSNAENEELKLMLGETDNTHDLTIALYKASTALQFTTALRDRFLEAYREIMQIQI